jgi:hypothetical protein
MIRTKEQARREVFPSLIWKVPKSFLTVNFTRRTRKRWSLPTRCRAILICYPKISKTWLIKTNWKNSRIK